MCEMLPRHPAERSVLHTVCGMPCLGLRVGGRKPKGSNTSSTLLLHQRKGGGATLRHTVGR